MDDRSPAELRREMRGYATPRDFAEAEERKKETARQAAAKDASAGAAREGAGDRGGAADRERDGASDRERDDPGTRSRTENQEPRRDTTAEGKAAAAEGMLREAEAESPGSKGDAAARDTAAEAGTGPSGEIAARSGPDGSSSSADRRGAETGTLIEEAGGDTIGLDAGERGAVRETGTGRRAGEARENADDARDRGDGPDPAALERGNDRSGAAGERDSEAVTQRERAGDLRADASTDETEALRREIAALKADRAEQKAEIAGLKDGMAKILAKLDGMEAAGKKHGQKDRPHDGDELGDQGGDQPSAAIGRNEREETSPEKEAVTRTKAEQRWRLPSDAANNVLGTLTAGAVTDLAYRFSGLSPEVAGIGATGVTAVAGGIAWWRERRKRKHDDDH